MNGYKMTADAYREFLNDPSADQEAIKTKIKALDFLATCDKATICALFDSSAFNDIVKGYVAMIADDAKDLTDEQRSYIKGHISGLFDMVQAAQAEAYYYNH